MDRLTSMRVFTKVVELAGFAAAGRALGLSTTMVGKHVAALEQRLGVSLLTRTTRRVVPTEAGLRYQAHCRGILAAVDEADGEVGAQSRAAVGCLRLTAPAEFGNLHVAPLVPVLMQRHPQLTVALDFSNRVVDLVEEGFDAAVRIAPVLDDDLRGRHVTSSRLVLVASPGYLRRHGTPRNPDALSGHRTLSFAMSIGRRWPFERDGVRREVPVQPQLLSNSSEALRCAACAGAGIALLPTFLVGDDLRAGRLRRVLGAWRQGALKIYVVYPRRPTQPARLRAFVDLLVERFGDDAQRDGFLQDA